MVYIPTDLLVDILQRLPCTTRRRLRLVSRSWRDLIHRRTTGMKHLQRRYPVPLVVTTESAYVLDDLKSKTGAPREVWPSGTAGGGRYEHMEVVGACNGVLCLCDDTKPGGAITLVNPATGDALALPQIQGVFRRHNTRRSGREWHQAYSFGYNHERGQYKVVHVPFFFKSRDTLHVFTLGEASWKEVPAAGERCRLDAGIVTVNGATYWVAEGSPERIVSFDLESEQVKTTMPPPLSARPICYLTEVESRLSIATASREDTSSLCYGHGHAILELWILENKRKEQAWIHQYSLRFSFSSGSSVHLARPNFLHGKYVLMVGPPPPPGGRGQVLFKYTHKHDPTNYFVTRMECGAVHTNSCSHKGAISQIRGHITRTFTYIKTTEAPSVYKRW